MPGRRSIVAAAGIALVAVLIAALGDDPGWNDYDNEANAAVQALARGDLSAFFAHSPAYGPSLLLRAPALLLAPLFGASDVGQYRVMMLPGVILLAGLAFLLWRELDRSGRPRAAVVAALLTMTPPFLVQTISYGHGEDSLATAFVGLAAVAAKRGTAVRAGVLLGLGVIAKPWAVAAVVPVLLLLERDRLRSLAATTTVTVAGWLPFLLTASHSITEIRGAARYSGYLFNPWQWWWFTGTDNGGGVTATELRVGYRDAPAWLEGWARPTAVLVPTLIALAVLTSARRAGRTVPPAQALAALALAMLLRGALDPWNVEYYALPFLVTFVLYEVHAHSRVPVASVAVLGATTATMSGAPMWLSPDLQSILYCGLTVPVFLYLLGECLRPQVGHRRRHRLYVRVCKDAPRWAALVTERERATPAR